MFSVLKYRLQLDYQLWKIELENEKHWSKIIVEEMNVHNFLVKLVKIGQNAVKSNLFGFAANEIIQNIFPSGWYFGWEIFSYHFSFSKCNERRSIRS